MMNNYENYRNTPIFKTLIRLSLHYSIPYFIMGITQIIAITAITQMLGIIAITAIMAIIAINQIAGITAFSASMAITQIIGIFAITAIVAIPTADICAVVFLVIGMRISEILGYAVNTFVRSF